MKSMRWTALVTIVLALGGCCKKGTSDESGSGPVEPKSTVEPPLLPAPASAEKPVGSRGWAGVYQSNWGKTTFEENGSVITARYSRGTMTCGAEGEVLVCTWVEGSSSGKARLVRKDNGDLQGTWGRGASDSNGGPWNFTRMGESLAATSDPAAFSGVYNSNWGPTTFEQQGSTVKARYGRGSMTCRAAGNVLDCDWREGSQTGKARLVKTPDGNITGTWGNGSSATNGGPWHFTPKT